MHYESSDFLETADSDTLKQIARTRELTREYYFSDYGDMEKRTSILWELLGGIGENVAIDTPFHCDYGKNIFLGNDVIIIGENSVIGAGSVVTRPIPPNCVAVGNPCRVIRYFDTDRERRQYEV